MKDHELLVNYPYVNAVSKVLEDAAPYLAGVINKQYSEFVIFSIDISAIP